MDRRRWAALLCVLAAGSLCGCNLLGGLVGAEIEVRGTRRSLEEQVLGSFEHLGQEVYLLAGVRAVDPLTGRPEPPPPMTESEARALAARRRMEFNRDDVLSFKRLSYVGEGNDGLLVPFEEEMQQLRQRDPRRFSLVRAIVEEENDDRRLIMQRIVDTTPELQGEEGMAAVGRILAARYRRQAGVGVRIQMPDGGWTAKGEGR